MGVSLLEVIEYGGYNLNTVEDATWLVSKKNEFEELIEKAEQLLESIESAETERLEAEYKERFGE